MNSSSRYQKNSPRGYNGYAFAQKQNLEFILSHFASNSFPRTISTRTTEGRQLTVYNEEETLARFKQANYLDCRINAYSGSDIKGDPNFLFIDIDTDYAKKFALILKKISSKIEGRPTVLFTGSGFHIYQPIDSAICLDKIEEFSNYQEPSKQFLKFAEKYLSGNKCDPDHNPSFKSCMVRIPGSINSKNGKQVKIIQEWDRHRPKIALLVGSFYSWLATRKIAESERIKSYNYNKSSSRPNTRSIKWIENKLLKTPLDDYRKTIVNLVLAPYLINIRQLQYDQAFGIINEWLQFCAGQRKLDFNANYLINAALVNARKTNYKPMRLDTLKQRNPTLYKFLVRQN